MVEEVGSEVGGNLIIKNNNTMALQYNKDKNGGSWQETTKRLVWSKGRIIPNFSPELWRWDKCGKVMKYSEHGNRNSEHGWEIDHINPLANGGTDHLGNLQPLNWSNNAEKGDSLNWSCNS
jgi:hypothetical protein